MNSSLHYIILKLHEEEKLRNWRKRGAAEERARDMFARRARSVDEGLDVGCPRARIRHGSWGREEERGDGPLGVRVFPKGRTSEQGF